MSAPATFDQIQEVMQQIRTHMGKSSGKIALDALQLYCSFHHPSTPDDLANVFWDEDCEVGFGTPIEVVKSALFWNEKPEVFVVEVRRAVKLPSMFALVTPGENDEALQAIYYRDNDTATTRLEALPK